MILAEHLTKRYGNFTAVSDLSFTIGDGEIVGFLGPNGAGKSTTMNMLTGYTSCTSGRVEIDGHDILTDTTEAKKSIGYLPEVPPLYNEMTVGEYLGFVYELKGCTLNRKKHIDEILSVTMLGDVRGRVIGNLSKGYRQRIGIAQALVGSPKTIILDEPTIGLDPRQIVEIRNLIRILGRDHAVILSTHILAEVQAVCDRIMIINKGRLVADQSAENIARTAGDASRLRVTICGPEAEVLAYLRAVAGAVRVDRLSGVANEGITYLIESERGHDIRRDVFAAAAAAGTPIIAMERTEADLENVFIRLTDNRASGNSAKWGGK